MNVFIRSFIMKSSVYQTVLACCLGVSALSVHASYVCSVDGETVYSDAKISASCKEIPSEMPKAAPETVQVEPEQPKTETVTLRNASPAAAADKVDDIKILPQEKPAKSAKNTKSIAAEEEGGQVSNKWLIRLRDLDGKTSNAATNLADLKSAKARAAELNKRAKIIPAPVVAVQQNKPKRQLTRTQILQNEVRNEQAALVRAKVQLKVARKKGNQAKISSLTQAVSDREANIRAIQSEISR